MDLLEPGLDDSAAEAAVQWSPRIEGGTEQLQRNLIGERALGLPREPDPTRKA